MPDEISESFSNLTLGLLLRGTVGLNHIWISLECIISPSPLNYISFFTDLREIFCSLWQDGQNIQEKQKRVRMSKTLLKTLVNKLKDDIRYILYEMIFMCIHALCFYFRKDPSEHGWQHRWTLLQRGHLHSGHRELSRLLADHSVRDLTYQRCVLVTMIHFKSQKSLTVTFTIILDQSPRSQDRGGCLWWKRFPGLGVSVKNYYTTRRLSYCIHWGRPSLHGLVTNGALSRRRFGTMGVSDNCCPIWIHC